jgi:hypothetical protein
LLEIKKQITKYPFFSTNSHQIVEKTLVSAFHPKAHDIRQAEYCQKKEKMGVGTSIVVIHLHRPFIENYPLYQ